MKTSMIILGLADLHDRVEMLRQLGDVDADLIAFCGDLHNASNRNVAMPVAKELARLGPPVLIVPGNMDHKDVVPGLWNESGFIMMHRSSFRYEDCGFVGMGGMSVLNPNRVRDPARYYHKDEDVYNSLARSYQQISDSTRKIVMTHQPPRDARDKIYTGERTGSISLRRFVEEYQPDLLICGHIHEDRGEALIGSTRIINVGEMRKGYAALIELNDDSRVEWIEFLEGHS